MTVEENIETALLGRVATLSLTPALAVAWPNRDFTPPAGAAWLRVQHLPNASDRLFLRGSDPHRRRGILQIEVVAPLNAGPGTATRIAGEVALHFPADLALWSEGVKVTVSKAPDLAPALKEDAAWEALVSVRYEAFA